MWALYTFDLVKTTDYIRIHIGSLSSGTMSFPLLSVLVSLAFFVSALAIKCSRVERIEYIHSNLEIDCQNQVKLIAGHNPDLSLLDIDLACTSNCLGKYEKFLYTDCNDTKAANVVKLACLKDNTTTFPSCRYSFPDVANLEIFHSTTSCASNLLEQPDGEVTCTQDCKEQLDALIQKFGCCFQSVYNDMDSVASLQQENFLAEAQVDVLEQFQMTSLLRVCRREDVPNSCSGQPFTKEVSTVSGDIANSKAINAVYLYLLSLLFYWTFQ